MAYFNYKIIEQFDWNEKLWLLGDVVTHLGDGLAQLSDGAIEAAECLKLLTQDDDFETLGIIYGISIIKLHCPDSPTSPEPIVHYSDTEFAIDCGRSWGDYLEELSFNDALWILHQAIYERVNAAKLAHRDELDELAEGIEKGALSADGLKLLGSQLAFSLASEIY
ncbi:MAG: hypothetical protein WBA07_32855 [Rivularia sp. (in: cyanobacteria)]